MGKLVVINDGEHRWVAHKLALVEALDYLGWGKSFHCGHYSRTEPEGGEAGEAYDALCNRVPAINVAPTDKMPSFEWCAAECAWLWVGE